MGEEEWECPECVGGLLSPLSLDRKNKTVKKESCPKCKGKGTITRPATQEEVIEYTKKSLEYYAQDNLHPESITINGGILKIEEKR